MGASSKTTEFLKECMADALIDKMKEKPFQKVTINEIASSSGVNRSTWFRNFSDKYEAISFKLIRLWEKWADEYNISERQRYTVSNAKDFFAFNYSIKDLLSRIYSENLQLCVYNAFNIVMMPRYPLSAASRYEAKFYSHGLFGFLDEWVKRGFLETPEEVTSMFLEMMKK